MFPVVKMYIDIVKAAIINILLTVYKMTMFVVEIIKKGVN